MFLTTKLHCSVGLQLPHLQKLTPAGWWGLDRMHVKCLTWHLAKGKLNSVAINVVWMTSGPLEERGRCGRWHLAIQMVRHFPSQGAANRTGNTEPRSGVVYSWRGRERGYLSKVGKNVFTRRWKTFHYKGEDQGLLKEEITQAQEESSQEAITDCMPGPRPGMVPDRAWDTRQSMRAPVHVSGKGDVELKLSVNWPETWAKPRYS